MYNVNSHENTVNPLNECVQILKRKSMFDLNLEVTEIGTCPRFFIRYTYEINLKLLHRSVFKLLHSRVLSARLAGWQ